MAFAALRGMFLLLAIIALPLLGALADGRDLAPIFRFPPRLDIAEEYRTFSWLATAGVLIVPLVVLGSWLRALRTQSLSHAAPSMGPLPPSTTGRSSLTSGQAPPPFGIPSHPTAGATSQRQLFPWWGWAALLWLIVVWALAWTRLPWFAPLQRFTFFPLWFGFIVVVNASTLQRSGRCLLTHHTATWLGLFATSAVFWWGFEWLNRFVRNWHYLGVEDFGAAAYALNATLCFSTVLPAVAGIAEWLETFASWQRFTRRGPSWRWFDTTQTTALLLVLGAGGLFAAGLWPRLFYPALWVGSLALLLALPDRGAPCSLRTEIAAGDWRRALTWMTASLLCGACWEMWNSYSAAKWIYTVPGVDRWHVFEMPLLGFLGYLPFGLECLLAAECFQSPNRAVTTPFASRDEESN